MVTLGDVRELALALPGTAEKTSYGNVAFTVGGKLFVWERPLRSSACSPWANRPPRCARSASR